MPDTGKKPRVRKTAPTLRERAEAAQAKSEKSKSSRTGMSIGRVGSPFKKVASPLRSAGRPLKVVGRPLKRVAGWLGLRYLVNAWREVRLVIWPSRRETWRLTGAVFIFAIIFGALVAGVDKGLDEVFKKLVLK